MSGSYRELAGALVKAIEGASGAGLIELANEIDDARTNTDDPFIITVIDAISMSGFQKMRVEAADKVLKSKGD